MASGALCYTRHMIVAVDTGGTKTLIEQFSPGGDKTHLAKFPTPHSQADYCDQVADTIRPLESIDAIVVALPGTVTDGIATHMTNLPWHTIDIEAELQRRLENCPPVFVENDANLGGLGEVRARQHAPERCLYVTISTGIGGGLIVNGQIDTGTSTSEIGHMVLSIDDHYASWEHHASGRSIHQRYHKLASDIHDASEWRDIARRISAGFLALLPVLRPDLIIIGGGVGAHYDNFSATLERTLNEYLPSQYRCPIIRAEHPEEAVIYGCYYYGVDALAAQNS